MRGGAPRRIHLATTEQRGLRLYEIPDRLREIEARIIEAEGEITPEIEAELEEAFNRKAEYIALLSREAKAEAAAVKQEEDRLRARRTAAEKREKRLKDYLQACMIGADVERIEGERAKIRRQRNGRPSIGSRSRSTHSRRTTTYATGPSCLTGSR